LPLELLDRWHREADERLPEGAVRPGHLGLWFRLWTSGAAQSAALLRALRANPLCEHAELEPIPFVQSPTPVAGDIPPPTPSFAHLQGYRELAPSGLGAAFAQRLAGGRGELLRVLHVEVDWRIDHEDLDALTPQSFIGVPTTGTNGLTDHGTAVAGILVAGRNGYGVTGLVDRTDVRLVGWEHNGGIANSIALATQASRPGDVGVLIASYVLNQTKPKDLVPVEYFQVNFDAVLTATTQGMILVSAAGNGDNDLDDPRFNRRFDLGFRDSGAIMVGATDGPSPTRASFSNYGSRIDAAGWGDSVTTCGYGTLFQVPGDKRQDYTERYAGTSGGTAVTAATLTGLLGVVRFQDERVLTPLEVRALLRGHGTPVSGNIGTRPDAAAMLQSLGLPDGLESDRAGVGLGETVTLTLRAAAGSSFALIAGGELAKLDLGLNRKVHVALATAMTVGGFSLPSGALQLPVTVPNDPTLLDVDLYLQGVTLAPNGVDLRVTSSVAVWIR
jgi:hypothetical protein